MDEGLNIHANTPSLCVLYFQLFFLVAGPAVHALYVRVGSPHFYRQKQIIDV